MILKKQINDDSIIVMDVRQVSTCQNMNLSYLKGTRKIAYSGNKISETSVHYLFECKAFEIPAGTNLSGAIMVLSSINKVYIQLVGNPDFGTFIILFNLKIFG